MEQRIRGHFSEAQCRVVILEKPTAFVVKMTKISRDRHLQMGPDCQRPQQWPPGVPTSNPLAPTDSRKQGLRAHTPDSRAGKRQCMQNPPGPTPTTPAGVSLLPLRILAQEKRKK
jgi:hypothetical protein